MVRSKEDKVGLTWDTKANCWMLGVPQDFKGYCYKCKQLINPRDTFYYCEILKVLLCSSCAFSVEVVPCIRLGHTDYAIKKVEVRQNG